MKKSLHGLIIAMCFVFTMTASTNPSEKVIIIDHAIGTVSIDVDFKEFFSSATYNKKSKSFEFEALADISFVQIFNDKGELEFQLPVMADNVKIKESFFEKGSYKLGFMLDSNEDILFTDLMMN